jgi:translation initiation factor IF-1
VDLTDGTKIEVPVDKIRHAFTQPEIIKGSMINGKWLGEGNWYPGTVTRVRPNGTFDIVYDDGDEELAVDHQNIVVRSVGQERFSATKISNGSLINGNFFGRGRWYPGTVTRVRPNGTFDIAYDDGDEELAVDQQNIVVRSVDQERISSTNLKKKDGRELCRVAALLELSGHMTVQNENGVAMEKRHVSI